MYARSIRAWIRQLFVNAAPLKVVSWTDNRIVIEDPDGIQWNVDITRRV